MKYLEAMYRYICIVLCVMFCGTMWAQEDCIPAKPSVQTSVYDYSSLLSREQKTALERKLIAYSDSTSTQIVVAIKDDLCGNDISMLAINWAHKWGVGQEKEDNGVFILLSPSARKIFIATGYGVEGSLTDAMTRRIIEQCIIPSFRTGDYYGGLMAGVDAIFEVLTGQFTADDAQGDDDASVLIVILPIIVFIVIVVAMGSSADEGRGGGASGGGGGRGGMSTGEAVLLGMLLGSAGRSRGGGYSSGGFGGGFGGGGFSGGFGGGGFGGGGAGGSW